MAENGWEEILIAITDNNRGWLVDGEPVVHVGQTLKPFGVIFEFIDGHIETIYDPERITII